ncbi:MAG: hypothetical protein NE327_01310 [Lentisphaeraceae bacterium]|nr:hypothetical protein [Lentisphaeraceae bacterium]
MNIWEEIMGWTAMGMILLGYFLISTNKVNSRNISYQLLNLIGSILFIIYLSIKEAWASVGLNVAWAVIAICSLWAIFTKKKKEDFGNNSEES